MWVLAKNRPLDALGNGRISCSRMSRSSAIALLVAASGVGGCELLVSTDGLSGGAARVPGEGGAGDGAAIDGSTTSDGPIGADGNPSGCDGPCAPAKTIVMTAGGNHTCALVDGVPWCWGQNDHGQLGDGTTTNRPAPVRVGGLPAGPVTALGSGIDHTCAVVGGDAWCWGNDSSGELGVPNVSAGIVVKVPSLPAGQVTDVKGGFAFTCAVAGGSAYCWVTNGIGQLGDGTTTSHAQPSIVNVTPFGTLANVAQISSGNDHACAVTTDGTVYCWGHSDNGVLGNPAAGASSSAAVPVQGLPGPASRVVIGGWHACATIAATGALWCWGTGAAGELGNGTNKNSGVAVESALTGAVTSFDAAGGATDLDATCAVQNGAILCWGNAQYGRLGDGLTTARSLPFTVAGLAGAISVAGGDDHFCAASGDGAIRCWGRNAAGQLGDGTTTDRLAPATVITTGM